MSLSYPGGKLYTKHHALYTVHLLGLVGTSVHCPYSLTFHSVGDRPTESSRVSALDAYAGSSRDPSVLEIPISIQTHVPLTTRLSTLKNRQQLHFPSDSFYRQLFLIISTVTVEIYVNPDDTQSHHNSLY